MRQNLSGKTSKEGSALRKLLVLLTAFVLTLCLPAVVQAKVPQPGNPGVWVAEFWIGQKVYPPCNA